MPWVLILEKVEVPWGSSVELTIHQHSAEVCIPIPALPLFGIPWPSWPHSPPGPIFGAGTSFFRPSLSTALCRPRLRRSEAHRAMEVGKGATRQVDVLQTRMGKESEKRIEKGQKMQKSGLKRKYCHLAKPKKGPSSHPWL